MCRLKTQQQEDKLKDAKINDFIKSLYTQLLLGTLRALDARAIHKNVTQEVTILHSCKTVQICILLQNWRQKLN